MTDQSPLITHTQEAAPPYIPRNHHCLTLDDIIEHCIGEFDWSQMLHAILISFAWFFDAQQTFISVFTDSQPKWSCIHSSSSCDNANVCELPRESWSWNLPASTSTISEWSLECANPIIVGLPASSFFMGCLAGGFALATLADSTLGRKNMLVVSSLVMSLSGVLAAVATNVWIYAALRFVCGFGRATIGTCALVLSTELVGKKWRGSAGIVGFLCFSLGFLSLPAEAYLLRGYSWRLIYLLTSVPSLLYSILMYFAVQESPRWLFIKGRKEEFIQALRSIAGSKNRSRLTESFFNETVNWGEKVQERDIYSAMKILLKKGSALRRIAAVMAVGFGVGMIYYGMPLGLGNLSFDLYLGVALNALSEFPASFITFFLIGKLNRKSSILGLTAVSGICSVACVLVRRKGIQMGLELVSFFSACTATNVVLIYALELFPTCVRNSAVSMVRQAVVLAGVLSPMLVAAGKHNGLISYGVFGVTIGLCGWFVVWLPETKGRTLCDTMEEEEYI
ncbi:Organic cation/carnitine transporter 3 [Dorcoceras hygrometricum]|uniref:Organic cation/carnitine transporter 3 n=1 Tax=Dorcoceras hygrometricum TaxID=472368 RepID=A0A2Z7CZ17_9LAMI|nr:Organic cation/carnitine transporter 3 [Dorcoceras hygrometricum]